MFYEKVQKRVEEHYKYLIDKGYEVAGIFLVGSYNYGLEYEKSDVDTKAIIIPSVREVLFNSKPISKTIILENGEHIEVKDIREMIKCLKKQNLNFLEILFTKYFVFNPKYENILRPLFKYREKIACYDVKASINCARGMIYKKRKNMEKERPGNIENFQKYGYDCKELHHILRMVDFLEKFCSGELMYYQCLIPIHYDTIMKAKQGKYTIEQAKQMAEQAINRMESIYWNFSLNTKLNREIFVDKEFIDNLFNDVVEMSFYERLKETNFTGENYYGKY